MGSFGRPSDIIRIDFWEIDLKGLYNKYIYYLVLQFFIIINNKDKVSHSTLLPSYSMWIAYESRTYL